MVVMVVVAVGRDGVGDNAKISYCLDLYYFIYYQ